MIQGTHNPPDLWKPSLIPPNRLPFPCFGNYGLEGSLCLLCTSHSPILSSNFALSFQFSNGSKSRHCCQHCCRQAIPKTVGFRLLPVFCSPIVWDCFLVASNFRLPLKRVRCSFDRVCRWTFGRMRIYEQGTLSVPRQFLNLDTPNQHCARDYPTLPHLEHLNRTWVLQPLEPPPRVFWLKSIFWGPKHAIGRPQHGKGHVPSCLLYATGTRDGRGSAVFLFQAQCCISLAGLLPPLWSMGIWTPSCVDQV